MWSWVNWVLVVLAVVAWLTAGAWAITRLLV